MVKEVRELGDNLQNKKAIRLRKKGDVNKKVYIAWKNKRSEYRLAVFRRSHQNSVTF